MIKSITNNFMRASEARKRLVSNMFSLGILQGANYILPLITVPYLVRVLGVEYFGLLAFALAINTYFFMITDYGFNLTATRDISANRNNLIKVSEIFSAVIIIKLLLTVISFIALCVIVFSVERFRTEWIVYLLSYGIVIGQVLFPVWLYQGMERMKLIAYINITTRAIATLSVFIFVQEKDDYWIVPLINSLGFIAGGIISLIFAYRYFKVELKWVKPNVLITHLKKGWHIFLSRIYDNFYTNTNLIILGAFTNNIIVGYYSIAYKVYQAISGFFVPILQAIYPSLVRIYQEDKIYFFSKFKHLNLLLIYIALTLFGITVVLSEEIIVIISGGVNWNIELILLILSVSVLTSPFGPSFTNAMLVIGHDEIVSKVVRNTMFLSMLIIWPLVYYYEAIGLAITWSTGQLFHVVYYNLIFNRLKKQELVR